MYLIKTRWDTLFLEICDIEKLNFLEFYLTKAVFELLFMLYMSNYNTFNDKNILKNVF